MTGRASDSEAALDQFGAALAESDPEDLETDPDDIYTGTMTAVQNED